MADLNTSSIKFQCDFPDCNKTFSKNWRLLEHTRSHTGERPYVCAFEGCSKTFIRPFHLKRHILTHTEQEKVFKCSFTGCDQAFALKHNLNRHEKRSHGKKFKCDFEGCGMEFKKSNLLKRHHCLIHQQDKKIYKCEVDGCEAGFNFPSRLKRHMKMHTKGYVCGHAGCCEAFETHHLFRQHIKSHGYTCSKCNKVFPEVFELKRHKVVHNTTREVISCPREGCSKFYSKASNLKKHIQAVHDGAKPYECPAEDCDKKFAHKVSLDQHVAVHKGHKRVKKSSKKKQKLKKKRQKTRESVKHKVPLARQISGYQSTSSEQQDQETETPDLRRNSESGNNMATSIIENTQSQSSQVDTDANVTRSAMTSEGNVDLQEITANCRQEPECTTGSSADGIESAANTPQDFESAGEGPLDNDQIITSKTLLLVLQSVKVPVAQTNMKWCSS